MSKKKSFFSEINELSKLKILPKLLDFSHLKKKLKEYRKRFRENARKEIQRIDTDMINEDKYERFRTFTDGAASAFLIIAVFFFIHLFIGIGRVSGHSMEDAFSDGDFFLYIPAWMTEAGYGDIVLVEPEDDIGIRGMVIKRIIAMGGDTVCIQDGKVFVNGVIRDEAGYVKGKMDDLAEITVPDGHIFIMGDNRDVSYDSRSMGTVNADRVLGVVRKKIF